MGVLRRSLIGVATATLVLAAGCGDDGGGGNGDAGDGSDAIGRRAGEQAEAFCAGFADVEERFADADITDPAVVDDALEALRQLDPPDELADDYAVVIAGFEALAGIDLSDEEAVAEVQEEFADAEGAFAAVEEFVNEEC